MKMEAYPTKKSRNGSGRDRVDVPGRVRQSKPGKQPCGRIWPNGEFGIGYMIEEQPSDPDYELGPGGCSIEAIRAECERLADGPEGLDLTSLPNSHIPTNRPETYGRNGLSGYGGKMVRNGGYLLQRSHGKRNLTFLTLTLPPMPQESARLVAESWGETVRQFLQWLSRQLERQGLSTSIVSVTELQTARLEGGDSACLHLHAVFRGRHVGGSWALTPKEVRGWWLSRLSRVTGGNVESMNCVDMKPVKRDAGNYLSKYMSKGAGDIEDYASLVGWECVPRQWWNMTKALRDEVKRGCLTSGPIMKVLDELIYMHWNDRAGESFKFVRAIEVRATEYQSFVVGFWGKMNEPMLRDLAQMATMLNCD